MALVGLVIIGPMGRPQPHDVRGAHGARHRLRPRARLRQLRRDLLRRRMLGYWDDLCSPRSTPRHRGDRSSTSRRSRKGSAYIRGARDRRARRGARPGRADLGGLPTRRRTWSSTSSSSSGATGVVGGAPDRLLRAAARSPIAGLVVMRRRRIPIFPILAIVARDHDHRRDRLPRHRYRAVVRRRHAGARRGRDRRTVAPLARAPPALDLGTRDAPDDEPLPTAPTRSRCAG